MSRRLEFLLHQLLILCSLFIVQSSQVSAESGNGIKTKVFLSPKIELEPGLVSNKFYYDMDFPRGHIAIKSFDAEVIDDKGNPIPLHETYLHHWVVVRYYLRKGLDIPKSHEDLGFYQANYIRGKNSGLCDNALTQFFGLGSETRKTRNDVPDPYGIEVGNPADIPDGFVEKWLLNVHAIDTRGAEDKLACTECRCDLYNVTIDESGHALPSSYGGGLRCCYDQTRCRVKESFQNIKRSLYLKYTVKYLDWEPSIVPVQIYILDVTDEWIKGDESRGIKARHHCLVEYDVEACPVGIVSNNDCIHTKTLTVDFPSGGDVIYGVAHLHSGGTGSALFGEGGRQICSSYPIYGTGHEPGDEAGYIVGMSSCYPSPGSVKIAAGETLTLVANYSSAQTHTGVMALFYLLIAAADSSPKQAVLLHQPAQTVFASKIGWSVALLGIGLVVIVIIFMVRSRGREEEEYEPIIA
ncbi:uncharacterized protein LOC127254815 isoform X2 [Andrographis paniculata]|nr:uncharacterized protein LOC127254815 isoform X2 [Andrographis paniculata]